MNAEQGPYTHVHLQSTCWSHIQHGDRKEDSQHGGTIKTNGIRRTRQKSEPDRFGGEESKQEKSVVTSVAAGGVAWTSWAGAPWGA